jgi:hypothetical protein
MEVRADPVSQALGFANIDHLTFGVLVEVHAWRSWNGTDFLLKIHQ